MRLDAHNYSKRIESFFLRLEQSTLNSLHNKETLKRFRDFLTSESISLGRVSKYLTDLQRAGELLGTDFEKADEQEIRRIVSEFDRNDRLSPWTKRDFKVALRKFYTWLRGTKEYPPEVSWLKVYARIRHARSAEEMLTENEVRRIIDFARSAQLKAFISVLYESGCRIGELIYLKVGQTKFDEYGAQLFVTGKTGFRRVRVVACVPYLTSWLNMHPLRNDPAAYLWLTRSYEPYSYNGLVSLIRDTAREAGIKKKVNPHNFRHSRATFLANHLTEAQMKEHFGWTQDSKMAAVYVHLSGRDVDNALLKVYGIEGVEEKKESAFKPKVCSRCHQVDQPTNRFCSRCGLPLDEEAMAEVMRQDMERKEADLALDRLIEDGEFRGLMLRKLIELKSMGSRQKAIPQQQTPCPSE